MTKVSKHSKVLDTRRCICITDSESDFDFDSEFDFQFQFQKEVGNMTAILGISTIVAMIVGVVVALVNA